MGKEKRSGSGSHFQEGTGVEHRLPGMIEVFVAGLRPTYEGWGRVGSNLLEVLPHVRTAIFGPPGEEKEKGKKWYPKLLRDVKQGKKKAIVVTALGSLIIFVAAAGIELGLRHGQDLREFDKLLERGKKK